MTAQVVVNGTGAAPARPDRAVLAFDVSHIASTASEALQEVAQRSARLEQLLRDHGVAEADWTTTGVTVQPAYEWRRDQSVLLGQRAANRLQVTAHDAALVGRLLTDAVSVAGARVGGPQWIVEPANPAHATACAEAAHDARRRAEAYAAGLGLSLGEVVLVDETHAWVDRPMGRAMMAVQSPPSAGDDAPLEVNAGDLEVTADVTVTFCRCCLDDCPRDGRADRARRGGRTEAHPGERHGERAGLARRQAAGGTGGPVTSLGWTSSRPRPAASAVFHRIEPKDRRTVDIIRSFEPQVLLHLGV